MQGCSICMQNLRSSYTTIRSYHQNLIYLTVRKNTATAGMLMSWTHTEGYYVLFAIFSIRQKYCIFSNVSSLHSKISISLTKDCVSLVDWGRQRVMHFAEMQLILAETSVQAEIKAALVFSPFHPTECPPRVPRDNFFPELFKRLLIL